MSCENAISLRGVSKTFRVFSRPRDRLLESVLGPVIRFCNLGGGTYSRQFAALNSCSIDIQKGEAVGIIGRNGSGKSTLLQLICGTLMPSSGSVETTGRIAALLELGSGFNPEFTGKENVYLNASLLGLSREEIDKRYQNIVAFADIGDFVDQPVKTYSSGMMVRLAFAVIAHVDADILIIDEALAVGDAFFTQKCMGFIRGFMREGTVLFVSHDTSAVRALCTRAIWLNDGEVRLDGDPKSIAQKYLEETFRKDSGVASQPSEPGGAGTVRWSREGGYARDQRDQFINHSNLRNDLRVFTFDPSAEAYETGAARIIDVRFTGEDGHPLSWIVGGEGVQLEVSVMAHEIIMSPIVGFYVKDRLGQEIFGDNTYLSYAEEPLTVQPQRKFRATFRFQMPRLAKGDYSVTVAIAEGDQLVHQQHHWIHDAVVFRSETSSVASGIVGIPMAEIKMEEADGHE